MEHSDNIIREFEDEGLVIYQDKPNRKIVFTLGIREDGTYLLVIEGNGITEGSNFTRDILPVIMYEKDLFFRYLKEIDKEKK